MESGIGRNSAVNLLETMKEQREIESVNANGHKDVYTGGRSQGAVG